MACSVARYLLLTDLSELVDLCGVASDRGCDHLDAPGKRIRARQSVYRRLGLELDNADSRVVLGTVVNAIAEVANPVLELGRVVLGYDGSVGDNGGVAGDRGPFTGGVAEGHIAVGVGVDVIGLAGLGVGVKDEVDAAVLLQMVLVGSVQRRASLWETYRSCDGHAA